MPDDFKKKFESAKNYIEKQNINPKNKKNILLFVDQLSAEGLTRVRQVKYLYTLGTISRLMDKDFSKATKQDIIKFCSNINNSDYSEWTKRDFKIIIKRFYKWIREQEGKQFDKRQYPDEVKWINTSMKRERKKLPKELLTIDDVKKLAENSNNLRNRCYILVSYESGARIGELLNLKLKDIETDKYGTKLTLFGKTGARKIRIIASAPAISNWLIEHPGVKNKESFLFCGIWSKKRGEEVNYATFNRMLKETAEKAGITKPVNPHHFRHSRATELAKILTESQLCQYMGWIQGSKEAATYVHLSGRDMDKAILKMHGLQDMEEEESKFKTITCPRCGTINTPESKFCGQCSLGLDLRAVIDYERTSKETLQNIDDSDKLKNILDVLIKKVEKLEREKYKQAY